MPKRNTIHRLPNGIESRHGRIVMRPYGWLTDQLRSLPLMADA